MQKKNVAVIGVGAVGIEILKILKQRNFPIGSLRVFARTARKIEVDGSKYNVEAVADENFDGIDIALFAGTEGEKGASVLYAQKFIDKGAVVIDNGNDFRLKKGVPLIVPEVNKDKIPLHKGLIANPNCTTIQAVTALAGIQRAFGLSKMILTSFQATSGAGRDGPAGLWDEIKELVGKNKENNFENIEKNSSVKDKFFGDQIALNVIPVIGGIDESGYTSEEQKVVDESRKIFNDPKIKISATCARVPVINSHSEAIYFVTEKDASIPELEKALEASAGVVYLKDRLCLPLEADGKDEVFVSRLRADTCDKNSFWIWCVSDNLRKGAALNAVQIAELL